VNVQVAHIDRLILGTFTLVDTTRQDLEIHVRIRREEERQRIPFTPRSVPDTMYRRLKLAVGLPLEILADVTNEGARFWRRVDPDAVLVEDLEGRDRVLEDEC
jgi:hypothetical protein